MIYILKKNSKIRITSLKSQECIDGVNKKFVMLLIYLMKKKDQNLIQCAEIVKQVPVKCLKRTQSLMKYGL